MAMMAMTTNSSISVKARFRSSPAEEQGLPFRLNCNSTFMTSVLFVCYERRFAMDAPTSDSHRKNSFSNPSTLE
jgi:hypothetical protein